MQYLENNIKDNYGESQEVVVIGPMGEPMTVHDLPAPGIERWVVRRKAEVVAGVRGGLISFKEACSRYNLSVDEFETWIQLFDNYGLSGLRATGVQKFGRYSRIND